MATPDDRRTTGWRVPAFLGLPILWLFLGPPILRQMDDRGAMASLAGQFDVWNVIRLGWWTLFGLLAVVALWRHQAHVRGFLRTMPQLGLWGMVWLATLMVSSAFSPSPLFTLANAITMVILLVAAFDLGVRLHARTIDLRSVLRGLYAFSISLQAVIVLAFVLDPGRVSKLKSVGIRMGGGFIGDTALLATVVFFLSAFFSIGAPRGRVLAYRLAMVASVLLVLSTQTRTAYIALAVGIAYMGLQWFLMASQRARVVALGLLFVTAGVGTVSILTVDTVTGTSVLGDSFEFLLRDDTSWRTASGRTAISAVLLEQVAVQPWGLGYSAGPRLLLLSSISELATQGVHAEAIGNAHNVFLEILAGGGVLGLFAFLAVVVWVGLTMHRIGAREAIPVRVLFVFCILAGLTSSNGALPFFQASVLTWLIVGVVAGQNAVEHAGRPVVARRGRARVAAPSAG